MPARVSGFESPLRHQPQPHDGPRTSAAAREKLDCAGSVIQIIAIREPFATHPPFASFMEAVVAQSRLVYVS